MSKIQEIIKNVEAIAPNNPSYERLQHIENLKAMDVVADQLGRIADQLQVLASQGGER